MKEKLPLCGQCDKKMTRNCISLGMKISNVIGCVSLSEEEWYEGLYADPSTSSNLIYQHNCPNFKSKKSEAEILEIF